MERQSCEIASLKEAVNLLTTQLSRMQEKEAEDLAQPVEELVQPAEQTWSEVVRNKNKNGKSKGIGRRKGKDGSVSVSGTESNGRGPSQGKRNGSSNSGMLPSRIDQQEGGSRVQTGRGEKVQVQGKRRVWGTLKACSSSAVKQAICRLTETAKENILSKRKYKTMRNNKIRWWHIISGDEDNLEKLEKEWEVVKAQTGWKLEKCYMDEENFLKAVTPLLP